MKAKKKWMFLGLTVLVVVAAGLGYWKRIGIRNTLYRMLDKQIHGKKSPFGKVYK